MIPFLDVKAAYQELKSEIDAAVARVLDSGWYILGPEVELFEQEYAHWVGATHCVGVANGLDAISLALRAVGIQADDEVIVPSNTYIATWLAVTSIGAVPVPVDPDPHTYCLDPNRVEAALTKRTKAILPVHLYGHPADVLSFREICDRRNLALVEDAAQAHGAAVQDTRIGTHGDAVAWSFYPGKNLGALGDGGAVTTNRADVAQHVALLRNYGSSVKYINDIQGVNSRLDPLQAAVLRVKLPALAAWNQRRAAIARLYGEGLQDLPLQLPTCAPHIGHAWHLYVILAARRDELQKALRASGVETLIHYPVPPFRQKAFAGMAADTWPLADQCAGSALSLPIGPHISSMDAEYVISAVRGAL